MTLAKSRQSVNQSCALRLIIWSFGYPNWQHTPVTVAINRDYLSSLSSKYLSSAIKNPDLFTCKVVTFLFFDDCSVYSIPTSLIQSRSFGPLSTANMKGVFFGLLPLAVSSAALTPRQAPASNPKDPLAALLGPLGALLRGG